MWKLRKYMMKYWYLFVLSILFIFGQVATELALPDAMSNIVSNGIQSGGFVNGVAEVLSKESYDALLDVSSSKDQKLIKTSYTLTNKKDLSEDVKDRFKNIKEDVYVLKEDVDQDELSDSLSKRIIVVNMLTHANMNSEQFKSFKEMAEKQIAYLIAKGEKEQSSLMKKALKEGNALFFVKQMPSSKQKEI
jgi:ATP-binding cassette subfamily B protein